MAIRAVCFDLGGVVARISFHLADMARRAGVVPLVCLDEEEDIHSMPDFVAYQAGELSDREYMGRLALFLGGISEDDALQVHCRMLIEPFPGILEIVEALNKQGIITGCLSNTNAPHWHELAQSGRFPAVLAMQVRLASHEIDAAKPDPRAFAAFCEAAGCEPQEVLLFDDSESNCIAASRLGWNAQQIQVGNDPASQVGKYLSEVGLLQSVRFGLPTSFPP